jgi:hypothetical protein
MKNGQEITFKSKIIAKTNNSAKTNVKRGRPPNVSLQLTK